VARRTDAAPGRADKGGSASTLRLPTPMHPHRAPSLPAHAANTAPTPDAAGAGRHAGRHAAARISADTFGAAHSVTRYHAERQAARPPPARPEVPL